MKRERLESREDLQTLKDRLIGKRIVTADAHIARYKPTEDIAWEPRVYLSIPPGKGLDSHLQFETQPASFLLSLPAEVRNHIMGYVVPPQQVACSPGTDRGNVSWINTSAVIFCCKQLYAETRRLCLEKHTFEYEKFPRKTRLCGAQKEERNYIWDR